MTTTQTARVTVRRVYTSHPGRVIGTSQGYRILRAWRVHGIEDDRFVVETSTGLTIVDYFGHMTTCWHVGISPGDLARLKCSLSTSTQEN